MNAAEEQPPGAPKIQLASLADHDDYRVCSDDTDPRGWQIIDSNTVVVGSVSDLIIDLEALVARYIVCSIARGEAREVLVPTGFARLDNEHSAVHLDFVTALDIERLPTFHGLPISTDDSALIEQVLTGEAPTSSAEAKIVRRSDDPRTAS